MKLLSEFFALARERYSIRLKKQAGLPRPWTTDRTFQEFRFCNVFREDDRTTEWFRREIREPLRGDPRVLIATVAFRWFNLISTGELIKDILLAKGWDGSAVRARLKGKRPLVTGAFVVHSPNGKGLDKLGGLCYCIDRVAASQGRLWQAILRSRSLEASHRLFLDFPSLGRFMAYELVTDFRHTYLLDGARDINSWASAGPGAARGLAWVYRGNLDAVESYGNERAQRRMQKLMVEILVASRSLDNWPEAWPKWEMREVEHWLCEADKYWRAARLGERLKRRY